MKTVDSPNQNVSLTSPQAPSHRKRPWLVGIFLLFLAGGFAFFLLQNRSDTATTTPVATVEITASSFSPQTIKIKQGEGITWLNEDARPHHLTGKTSAASSEPAFSSSEPLAEGDSYTAIFDEKGDYSYHDPGYPHELRGIVIVE